MSHVRELLRQRAAQRLELERSGAVARHRAALEAAGLEVSVDGLRELQRRRLDAEYDRHREQLYQAQQNLHREADDGQSPIKRTEALRQFVDAAEAMGLDDEDISLSAAALMKRDSTTAAADGSFKRPISLETYLDTYGEDNITPLWGHRDTEDQWIMRMDRFRDVLADMFLEQKETGLLPPDANYGVFTESLVLRMLAHAATRRRVPDPCGRLLALLAHRFPELTLPSREDLHRLAEWSGMLREHLLLRAYAGIPCLKPLVVEILTHYADVVRAERARQGEAPELDIPIPADKGRYGRRDQPDPHRVIRLVQATGEANVYVGRALGKRNRTITQIVREAGIQPKKRGPKRASLTALDFTMDLADEA